MRIKVIVFIIVFFLVNIVTKAQEQDPQDYQPNIDLSSSQLVELEKKFVKTEDPQELTRLTKEIEVEANKNLFLLVNGQIFSANKIVACQKLSPDFHCSSDSSEEKNLSGKKISGKIDSIQAFLNPEYKANKFQFYLASSQVGGKPVPVNVDNSIKTRVSGKKEKILFAIVKGKDEVLLKKYIWLIQP
jgi:hypothetical protein